MNIFKSLPLRVLQQQSYRCSKRLQSTIILEQDDNTGLTSLILSKPPVNSLDGEFLTNISDTIKKLDKDANVKGLLIQSKYHGKVYSAGLNILDMYNKSDAHLRDFWRCVQEWYLDLYGFSKPVVAAINGHAPAGGCAMALMCDYRIMMEGKTIGLNETQLGISAPFFFIDLMTSAVGRRKAELLLQHGSMLTSQDALKLGMVDEVVDMESVIPEANKYLLKLSKIPQPAFGLLKNSLRGENIQNLRETREKDIDHFVSLIHLPTVQTIIGNYLESLKKRKK